MATQQPQGNYDPHENQQPRGNWEPHANQEPQAADPRHPAPHQQPVHPRPARPAHPDGTGPATTGTGPATTGTGVRPEPLATKAGATTGQAGHTEPAGHAEPAGHTEPAGHAGTAGGPGPAGAGGTAERRTEGLLPMDERERIAVRMQHALSGFVDSPRQAVEEAAGALETAVERLTTVLTERRASLRTSWDTKSSHDTADAAGTGGAKAADRTTDTEHLRLTLQQYREITDRLLRF
ncbi:hypothetical protein NX801_27070 [Streptomyces sp. LP05-1]|uniref:Uncharacterized protein n=1 Tax=Streptomyces pyxinae TaxID=2970734 RepID=A0ABT2CP77_9ACTN|nr:hypothetical protein [Streptomyces sp. LP05-1]MCS0639238.1 hypothetical protein [Streptomyces sp. LP05-1]